MIVRFALLSAIGCSQWPPMSATETVPLDTGAGWDGVVEIFDTRCMPCHSAAQQFGGVVLPDDVLGDIAAGGGSLVAPGDPEASLVVVVIGGTDEPARMPPSGPLPPAEVEAIVAWIAAGATFD